MYEVGSGFVHNRCIFTPIYQGGYTGVDCEYTMHIVQCTMNLWKSPNFVWQMQAWISVVFGIQIFLVGLTRGVDTRQNQI